MKKLSIYILLIGMSAIATANNQFVSDRSVQTITNNQVIDFSLGPWESKYFKIWIPANAAHLKIGHLTQDPGVFMWSHFGSIPVLQTHQPRPDCEFPAFSEDFLGIPFTTIRCLFERPQSGNYHYIKVFNERNQATVGLNLLNVRYQANGLSQVATVSMQADFIDVHSGQAETAVAHGISGDLLDHLERSFIMLYDESLGRFEERAGGLCDAGTAENPSYLKLQLHHSELIDGCSFRGSWDEQSHTCPQPLVNAINSRAPQVSVINTDDYDTIFVGGQCLPDLNSEHMPAGNPGVPNFHWFEFSATINGQSYPRRILIRKVNGEID